MRVVVLALICAGAAVPASAEIHKYYYLGGVYDFANIESLKNPMFTYGEMTIDDSKLPAGQTLANLRATWRVENDEPVGPDYMQLKLHNALGEFLDINKGDGAFYFDNASYMQFDKRGRPKDWFVEPRYERAVFYGSNGKGREYNRNYPGSINPIDENDGREFLRDRGYKEGTATFNRLLKEHVWANGVGSKGVDDGKPAEGRWYTNSARYVQSLIKRTQQALSRPPSNFYRVGQCRG